VAGPAAPRAVSLAGGAAVVVRPPRVLFAGVGTKKGAAAIYAHGPLELAPCPGGPDPAGPPFRLPERGCGAGTPRAGSAEERGGGLGVGPGAAVGHAQWLERLPEKKPLYTQSRTACRASRRGCAASGSRSPATTPPSRSPRSRSGTRVCTSTL